MGQEQEKRKVAESAVEFIETSDVIGVGTGSTVNLFIDALAKVKNKLDGVVVSSKDSADRVARIGIPVLDLNTTGNLPLYVDGADEAVKSLYLIKGGGGALTREKIVASACHTFICIIDSSKMSDMLGSFPLPIEVIPMAQSLVSRRLIEMGGTPILREDFRTDNGNVVITVRNLDLTDPLQVEKTLNNLPGVVENGLFAQRRADILLIGTHSGVERLTWP
jgi:ribose 5-phosphate isomerase A